MASEKEWQNEHILKILSPTANIRMLNVGVGRSETVMAEVKQNMLIK